MVKRNKMLRKMKLTGILILLIGIIAGCSQTAGGTENKSSAKETEYVLNLTHVVPETHATHLGSLAFKEEVEEKSDGRIKIEIYPNGQLYGSEREAIESTMLGNVDITFVGSPALASFDPRFMVLDLPYLFATREDAHEALDGELGDELDAVLAKYKLTSLGWGESGYKNMITNSGPIYSPKDLEGLKIRVMENKLYQDTFETLGAKASPIAFGELYTALQQGVFDGADQPVSLVASNKFHEAAPHYTMTEHSYAAAPAFISSKIFDGMPEDLQKVLIDAGHAVFENSYRELAHKQDTELLKDLEKDGMKVYNLTPEQKEQFIEATKSLYDDYEDIIGKDLVELAKSFSSK